MLTHVITIAQPIKPTTANDHKKYRRLRQDLKCKKFAIGDTILIRQGKEESYGQILDIASTFEDVAEWDGNAPLNVLVYLYDYQDEFLYNISSLEAIQ